MLKAYTLSHVLGGQVSLFILRYYSVWFREYKVLSWPSLGYLGTMWSYSVWGRNCKIFNVETWVKSEVFGNHVCYFDLLSFDNFFKKKNSARWLLNSGWWNLPFWSSFFSSTTLFLKGSAECFFAKKISRWKQVKISNIIWITKTSGLTQVWFNVS